jgi:uncharacterized protein (TIGR02231 family)
MSPLFRARAAAALLALLAAAPHAQEATRIVAATIYPDGASVERELKVPGGTRHVVLACMPAAVDVATLQVDGDPELRVGDIHATELPVSRTAECAPDSLEARRSAFDVQRAALEAQRDSNELALGWLRQWGARPPAEPGPLLPPGAAKAAADAPRPGATADSLRRAALDLMNDQARVKRELAALDRSVARLADEQPAARGKQGWRTVRFDVWTPAAASLRVRYAVSGAWWRPAYRASVDTVHASLRLERQADVVQASGEDWRDIKVRLSTGRVRRGAQGAAPSPWWVDLLEPRDRRMAEATGFVMAAAAAPAPAAPALDRAAVQAQAPEPAPWTVDIDQTATATEFALAQPVSLASDGESHTLAIAAQALPVTLQRRATPRTEAAVWLLAEAARPAGVWLPGPLQSFRDGVLVSREPWQPALGERFSIALGQDDQMRVEIQAPVAFTAATGLLGDRTERTAKAVYAVTNLHETAVTVELVDAAPVSRNELVKVRSTYEPRPETTEWHRNAGVAAWTLALAPGQTRQVGVTQSVSWPKDRAVAGLP